MVDPGHLELIHAEIDGELDARQRAELSRRLLADPAARSLRDDFQRLCRALDAVAEIEPPPQLRDGILAALPPSPARRSSSAAALRWRYAAMIAGVLVAGTLVFQTIRGPGSATRDAAGTMAPLSGQTVVDTVRMANNGPVGGRVSLYRDGPELGLSLELTSGTPVDVLIASGGHTLRVSGLRTPTEVALPGFPMAGQAVDVTFLRAGHAVGSATLRAPKGQ